MPNIDMTLLCCDLEAVVASLADRPTNPASWDDARRALVTYGVSSNDDEELSIAIEAEDAGELTKIVEGWLSGERLLLVRDRDVLKRAMKAFRKSLKVTVLDAESSLSGGHLSSGRESGIVGIVPPDRYPRSTWNHLVRQERLIDAGGGVYELGPKA